MRYLPSARSSERWILLVIWGFLAISTVEAQFGLVTREEALASVFPNATVAAERIFLTEEQVERIRTLSLVDLDARLYARYTASRSGLVVGRAYVDTHQVRTKKQSLLVSLDANGRVRRIDVTSFLEPTDYIAKPSWLRQFDGKPLNNDLMIQRSIRPITGATLTALSVNQAVRRVMAIDQVLMAEMEVAP